MGWITLLAGPLLVLGNLGMSYALLGPGCNLQRGELLHLPMAASFIVCLGLTLWAARTARHAREAAPAPGEGDADPDAAQERRRFIAWMAMACGALSCLVIAALWLPLAVLSPCAV